MADFLFQIWGQGMAAGFAFVLFVGMLAMLEAGWRLGHRASLQRDPNDNPGDGLITGAVLSLFGLLVAFTFSGAGARFDLRRDLIVEETNDLGTAYLRLDLTPEADRATLQEKLRRYLDMRLEVYRRFPDMDGVRTALQDCTRLQQDLWTDSLAACNRGGDPACKMLLLPALNSTFDIATTRTMAAEMHPPGVILATLSMLALASALLAGISMGSRPRHKTHMLSFAGLFAVAIFVIVDLEYPRLGLIRVDEFDRALIELRQSWD